MILDMMLILLCLAILLLASFAKRRPYKRPTREIYYEPHPADHRYRAPESTRHRYVPEKHLLTYHEAEFFAMLEAACPEGYRIFPKVRISDILRSVTGYGSHLHMSKKHVDFVVVCANTYRPVLAIELDDPSHRRKNRQKNDEAKDHAFKTANLPLLRTHVAPTYDREAFRRSLFKRIHENYAA
jgi:hypothetical protein